MAGPGRGKHRAVRIESPFVMASDGPFRQAQHACGIQNAAKAGGLPVEPVARYYPLEERH